MMTVLQKYMNLVRLRAAYTHIPDPLIIFLTLIGANPPRNVEETETVYETKCGWENCTREFDTQEQLVHVCTMYTILPLRTVLRLVDLKIGFV